MPAPPSGSPFPATDNTWFVACAAPGSTVCVVEAPTARITAQLPAGHTAMAPVLSPDGHTLFVCNRFNDDVSVLDLGREELARIPVSREPVAAALTLDGRFLFVANLLPRGAADAGHVAAVVSVIDTVSRRVTKELVSHGSAP